MGSQICWITGLQEFQRQSCDLNVYAPLDRKPMKLLQSLGDADASPLTCDNICERALQTLKPRNVLNQDPQGWVGLIEATADKRTGNVLGVVFCEVGTDVAECTDVIETGFWKCRDVRINESLLSRITSSILTWLETWTRVLATLTVEVIGRERERWVVPSTIASDFIYPFSYHTDAVAPCQQNCQ